MMFVGRKKELEYLEEYYKKGQSNILVVYGHGGVGKTSLCLKFANGKNVSYYLSRDCSTNEQLTLWNEEAELNISSDQLSFTSCLNSLPFSGEGKRLLIIDEFQNIVKNSDEFVSELVDFVKSANEQYFVILCSSSISFVENSLVPKIGTVAMGISGFFKVPELKFFDVVNYFKNYSKEQCMEVYSILGGMPSYWAKFSDKMSVEENIERVILSKDAPLRDEGLRVVAEELRELNVYCTLLNSMANGMTKLNDLHVHTGYSRAKISVYIKNMMEREIVEKVFSFDNASSLNAKKGVYRICNHYLAFYFKFIFRRRSKLELMGAKEFYDGFVSPGIDAFHNQNFKFVCQEYLDLMNSKNMLPIKYTKSGEWVGKSGDIDIVTQNDDWDNLLCFCDWEKKIFTLDDFNACLNIAQDARLKPDYVIIFGKNEFDAALTEKAKNSNNIELVNIKSL